MNMKLEYHHRLYLGDGISESKLDKIKKRLETKPLLSGVCLITLSGNPGGQLDIFQAALLVQKHYAKGNVYVVGIAAGYDEAVGLVEKIVQECLQERGDCSLREYLLCQP